LGIRSRVVASARWGVTKAVARIIGENTSAGQETIESGLAGLEKTFAG